MLMSFPGALPQSLEPPITNPQRSPMHPVRWAGCRHAAAPTLLEEPMTQTQPEAQPTNGVGSLAGKEAPSESDSSMRQWMVIAGVVIAIIGVIVMGVASNRNEDAQAVNRFSVALGAGANDLAVQSAVTLGYFGLAVLIAGVALALTGLVVIAARQATLPQNAEAEA
jgi:hypothetical protein